MKSHQMNEMNALKWRPNFTILKMFKMFKIKIEVDEEYISLKTDLLHSHRSFQTIKRTWKRLFWAAAAVRDITIRFNSFRDDKDNQICQRITWKAE